MRGRSTRERGGLGAENLVRVGNQAKTGVPPLKERVEATAGTGPAEGGGVEKAAPSYYLVGAILWSFGVILIVGAVRREPILTPLEYVPMHVMESPGIGLLLPDGHTVCLAVVREPCVVREFGCVLSEAEWSGAACSACVFPFGFGWQTKSNSTGDAAQSADESPGIRPGDLLDWQLRAVET